MRRAAILALVLSGSAVAAITAQDAAAATTGFTEKEEKGFPALAVTETTASGKVTTVEATIGGVPLKLESKKLSGTGEIVNEELAGEMLARGRGSITFKEVTVVAPAGKKCKVKGEEFATQPLRTTTKAQGAFMKFEPVLGGLLAEFEIVECEVAALNKAYKLEGSFKGVPKKLAISLSHEEITKQKTLTMAGQNAGIEGSIEITAGAAGQAFKPIEFK